MKPSEEEEFKEKSNEEKMEKEMKNNDEENDWNDWIYQWFFWLTLLSFHDAMFQYYFTMFLRIITTHIDSIIMQSPRNQLGLFLHFWSIRLLRFKFKDTFYHILWHKDQRPLC